MSLVWQKVVGQLGYTLIVKTSDKILYLRPPHFEFASHWLKVIR